MTLVVYGYNHNSAPLHLREQACTVLADNDQALCQLKSQSHIDEAIVLSTCNRIELVCITQKPETVGQWLNSQHQCHDLADPTYYYYYQNEQACQHLLRVACGLDSMVLGESQIFGQMKQAYRSARDKGLVGKLLGRLMESVFATAKKIRHHTGLNQYPVSVAYAAVLTMIKTMPDLAHQRLLLVGAGSTNQLMLQYLAKQGCQHFTIANRQFDTAQSLVEQYQARFVTIEDLTRELKKVDAVVSATASQDIIIHASQLQSLAEHQQPKMWIDLAVPRDLDPRIGDNPRCELYNIDHMQAFLASNWRKRQQAAREAEALIQQRAQDCLGELRTLRASSVIKAYRQQVYDLQQQELSQALQRLDNGQEPREVLNQLAYKLTQKILHQPTKNLRRAAYSGEHQHFHHAKKLLDIDE